MKTEKHGFINTGRQAGEHREGACVREEAASHGALKRLASGVFLIAATLYVVLYTDAIWLAAAVAAVTLLALIEYNRLRLTEKKDALLDAALLISGGAVPFFVYLFGHAVVAPFMIASLFLFFILSIFNTGNFRQTALSGALKVLGMVYIAIPLSYLILIKGHDRGQFWILLLLLVVWSNDTFAYVVGKSIGRHRLAPSLSPKKTIEGAAGGVISGLIAGFLFNRFLDMGMSLFGVAALSIAIGIIALSGDVAESLLKRGAGVKDSGGIIPGHGGVLDRLDSLLFTIPFLYYFLSIDLRTLAG
ncbi:MAG: phosphatidate cytidylyltransferase [Deltaproteobacteria bacterium]